MNNTQPQHKLNKTDIVVFASGNGSNFENLVHSFPMLHFFLVCNNPKAKVLEKASNLNVPFCLVNHEDFASRQEHEAAILQELQNNQKVKFAKNALFMLLGYMRILSPFLLQNIKILFTTSKILNLHPACLNTYKGASAYEFAHQKKFPAWSVSMHECTEVLDSGKLLQEVSGRILPWWNLTDLKQHFRQLEHLCVQQTVHTFFPKLTNVEQKSNKCLSTTFNSFPECPTIL